MCARCGATRMKALRLGVTRVRDELEALAGVAVAEVWGPAAAEGEEERVRRARVVVGTEAALHRVPDAAAVVFLEFDSELLAPRFRAAEQALALLARAARLVARTGGGHGGDRGPGTGGGPDTPAPAPGPRGRGVRRPRGARRRGGGGTSAPWAFPPSAPWRWCRAPAADAYGSALRDHAPEAVEVSGPVDGVWSVRAPGHAELCDLLSSVARPPGRLRVEVDPVRS